jgi:hypothetical protein
VFLAAQAQLLRILRYVHSDVVLSILLLLGHQLIFSCDWGGGTQNFATALLTVNYIFSCVHWTPETAYTKDIYILSHC